MPVTEQRSASMPPEYWTALATEAKRLGITRNQLLRDLVAAQLDLASPTLHPGPQARDDQAEEDSGH